MDADEYLRMQESAADRVRNMKRRADSYTSASREKTSPSAYKPSETQENRTTQTQSKGFMGRGAELFRMLNFKGIDMDSDRALITGMMLLLLSEGDDELLILALLYIML